MVQINLQWSRARPPLHVERRGARLCRRVNDKLLNNKKKNKHKKEIIIANILHREECDSVND
eukprot:m.111548 g.111548  ORF g.111548 m.111548 type:complete len:62 (+) comp12765_c0_seq1:966-1151(+)